MSQRLAFTVLSALGLLAVACGDDAGSSSTEASTGSETGSGGSGSGASGSGGSGMGSGGTTSSGMPSGDFVSYEMTLPGGEKQSRTCVRKGDAEAMAVDALGAGMVGTQVNLGCPRSLGTMVSAGGMYFLLKNAPTVTTFDYDNKSPDFTLWGMKWQTPIAPDGTSLDYSPLSSPADLTDTDALCTFKGSNDPMVGRIVGTMDCTWTDGAVLTVEFDTAYLEP
jgi:hypothetical protein